MIAPKLELKLASAFDQLYAEESSCGDELSRGLLRPVVSNLLVSAV